MPPAEPKLPNGLLIILHLHLLNFPLQDATGYDERLFDSSRGMRERNKAMEDISYFLVGKIEHGKDRAKAILPTYPCLQPSDTTAFKIALAKYIEAIRNSFVHTTHANTGDKQLGQKGKHTSSPGQDDAPAAWWWKDVVVRKSILDECCGERFERLILALSSHAVLKNTTRRAPSALQPLSAREHAIAGTFPKTYAARLAAAQGERLGWERSAAVLVRQAADLAVIRARLAGPRSASASKYESLETGRLLALRDSRQQDLLRGSWKGDEGLCALQLITTLAGLNDPTTHTTDVHDGPYTGAPSSADDYAQAQGTPAAETAPLPIAAARHPAHLHALAAPLFPERKPTTIEPNDGPSNTVEIPHAVTERLEAIGQVQRSLQEALSAVRGIHGQLQQRLRMAHDRQAAKPPSKVPKRSKLELNTGFWARRAGGIIEFRRPESAASMLGGFGLDSSTSEGAVEERIAHIRSALLPPFVTEPDPEPEPELDPSPPASRLPQPSSHAYPAKVTSASAQAGHAHGATVAKVAKPSRIAGKVPPRTQGVPTAATQAHGTTANARAVSRRLSRRASAARTRRSTMFGRGEDAEILRIVASIEDRSDSEGDAESAAHVSGTPAGGQPSTPARRRDLLQQQQGTRGTLLSSVKKTGPRQSYDIDRHERAAHVPRLPSLRLSGAPALDEEDEYEESPGRNGAAQHVDEQADAEAEDVVYEGNSMTLADILLHAGHQGNVSVQLLGEELEEEMSDWE